MVRSCSRVGGLFGFISFAYLISWIFWLPLAVLPGATQPHSPLRYLHLVGSLGPAMAGIIWCHRIGGRAALRQLFTRLCLWRVHWLWHLAVWLGPFLLLTLGQMAVGGRLVLGTILQPSPEYPELPVLLYWLATLIFYGFGEEIGWRGFALPVLQERFSPLQATLMVTVIWAVWHWPLFLFSPGLANLNAAGMAGWLFSLLTGACILTLVFNGTGGSVLLAAGFHATMDIAFLGPPEVMMVVGALISIIGIMAGIVLVLPGIIRLEKVTILTRD